MPEFTSHLGRQTNYFGGMDVEIQDEVPVISARGLNDFRDPRVNNAGIQPFRLDAHSGENSLRPFAAPLDVSPQNEEPFWRQRNA